MFYVDTLLWSVFCYIAGWIGLISCLTYAVIQVYQFALLKLGPQNLKTKYNATWAVVTGASSGIGKCIAIRLAEQEINVVLVAIENELFRKTFQELSTKYPKVTFRRCEVNLADNSMAYMTVIKEATKDISVSIVFNNAGYILPGFFVDAPIERLRENMECNAGCIVPITHYFAEKLVREKRRGLIAFTSSAATYLMGPTATMYSPSKAFMTNFAGTIACELKDVGVDVVVIHPSPIKSNFYSGQAGGSGLQGASDKLKSLQDAMKSAQSPDVIAEQLFCAAGRLLVWDQGLMCAVFRLVTKTLDFAFFFEVASRFAWLNGDHAKLARESRTRNNQ